MIEFLAGVGAVLAYQKRDKWVPIVKEKIIEFKNKIFKKEDNATEKSQKEFDFDFKI
jgi:hypothetical protein